MEVLLYLPLEHARRALRASGRAVVRYHLLAGDDGGTNVATHMTWFNVLLA